MYKFMPKTVIVLLLLLCAVCISCGGKNPPKTAPSEGNGPPAPAGSARYSEDGRRIITIGTWYDRYYVSKHTDITDNPSLLDKVTAQMRLDKIREVEKKYNVILNYVNLTFDGIQESINTSIPAGTADVDIYEVDLQFGIPAVLRGYAVSLDEMGLAGTDVFTSQMVMKYLTLTGQKESYLFAPSKSGATEAYVLAYNNDLIKRAGLPNPQDLYDRDEWTWDRWRDYLFALTKDTSGDNITDVYGYSGYWTNLLTNLLLSNNAGIAQGVKETLGDIKTREVFDFINTIYHTDKTARPWDPSNWEINNRLYAEGLSGFWIGADWIFDTQGHNLDFEIGVVPWPRGPHGSFKDNRHSLPSGNWYFIPRGVEKPREVYDVIFEWTDWYGGDWDNVTIDEWSKTMYMTGRNFKYAAMMASKPGFDLWENLGTGFSLLPMLEGSQTPDDVIEAYARRFQDALDSYFK
jgi:ABC-type glycerol-3-phosphate transport system substrate-binding protein